MSLDSPPTTVSLLSSALCPLLLLTLSPAGHQPPGSVCHLWPKMDGGRLGSISGDPLMRSGGGGLGSIRQRRAQGGNNRPLLSVSHFPPVERRPRRLGGEGLLCHQSSVPANQTGMRWTRARKKKLTPPLSFHLLGAVTGAPGDGSQRIMRKQTRCLAGAAPCASWETHMQRH